MASVLDSPGQLPPGGNFHRSRARTKVTNSWSLPAAGPSGFYGELIDLAGGTNIFADLPGDFAQVSAESIIERNPDIVLLTDTDLPDSPQTPDMVAAMSRLVGGLADEVAGVLVN